MSLYGGYRYGLADPLKRMIHAGFGIDPLSPQWETRKEQIIPALGVSLRAMMQTLGTEWGRQCINPDIWVIAAQDALMRRGPGMVISDVRYENEAAWVRRHGLLIHLVRPDATQVASHVSEAGVSRSPEDRVILNDGDLSDLFQRTKEVLGDVPKTREYVHTFSQ